MDSGRIPVEAITGVDDASKTTLNDAGIIWLDEFLEVAGPAEGRKALATQTGLDARQLLEWANRADLMRIAGRHCRLRRPAGERRRRYCA